MLLLHPITVEYLNLYYIFMVSEVMRYIAYTSLGKKNVIWLVALHTLWCFTLMIWWSE
jgi:hypothetical protein